MSARETATTVTIVFIKSAAPGFCAGRAIKYNHNGYQVPPQIASRVEPQLWADFFRDVEALGAQHPYLGKPGGKRVCEWLLCGLVGAVMGLCVINPDGGDYGTWVGQMTGLVQKWQDTFRQRGIRLSYFQTRDTWLQLDLESGATVNYAVNPGLPAYGQPVGPPPPGAGQPPYAVVPPPSFGAGGQVPAYGHTGPAKGSQLPAV